MSIAKKALAIAKRQEAERLETVKEEFLNIMRKEFEKRVNNCSPWIAIDNTYYDYQELFNSFRIPDLRVVCEDLGFSLDTDRNMGVRLSIPKWVKGQKRTEAQLMLYWSNIEINRNIKNRKTRARIVSNEALEKIKKGDFVSSKKHIGRYEIVVTVSHSEPYREFQDEVARIFAKKKFRLLEIDVANGKWKFEIEES